MSEKAIPDETSPLLRKRPQRFPKTRLLTILGLVAAISIIRPFFSHTEPREHLPLHADKESSPWSWDKVKPSRELKWEKCYNDEFECARLDVPMDWLDPKEDERVVLGVIKLAAKQKGGNFPPVFTNPGGPGGSGIRFLQRGGRSLQTIVGDNHDIISFDPRGVGISTPRVECWGTLQKRKLWSMQEVSVFDEHPGLIYDHYARAMAYSGACEKANNETGILRHLSSASLARDMLEILNKTGHKKLRYWGFSYGTILGGVFAGLFPERVERLVSDGNCDYTDWFKLDHANFISDADRIFDAFDTYCHKAGPEKCGFWDETPQTIQDRRSALLESLKKRPIHIPAWSRSTGPDMPVLVTYSKVQLLTRTVLYKPIVKFPDLAKAYAALERGDGVPYYDMVMEYVGSDSDIDLCTLGDTPATMPQEKGTEEDAFPAIMCSDNEPVNYTADEFEEYGKRLQGVSRWAGAANLLFRVVCLGRTVRPKWRFSVEDFKKDTAHPILFIGNMADNVTPLQSAYNNSALFPSSIVLKQNSYGHCSSAQPSTCTSKYIRAYFQNGTLPAAGTECESDYELFQLPTGKAALMEMDELNQAMFKLASEVDFGHSAF